VTHGRRSDSQEWLTLRQIADELGIALSTLYNRRHRGEGPRAYTIGGRLRVRRADLNLWLETMADEPQDAA
jgi:excisionase family DNA binding protein